MENKIEIGCGKLLGENDETYYPIYCDKNYMLCSNCKEIKRITDILNNKFFYREEEYKALIKERDLLLKEREEYKKFKKFSQTGRKKHKHIVTITPNTQNLK